MDSHHGDGGLPRLASLVVEALEIGTGKSERDVGEDICRALGVDLTVIEARFRDQRTHRKQKLREALAAELATAAGTSSRLITEVARCGGRFLAMVEEIYAFLATHRATTSGTSEEFRFRKDGVQLDLPISPAFIERVRVLEMGLRQVEKGTINQELLARFLSIDCGEFYGSWPVNVDWKTNEPRFPLPWAITHLVTLQAEQIRAHGDRGDSRVRAALARALAAGEALIDRAEGLLTAHAHFLRSPAVAEMFIQETNGEEERRRRQILDERQLLEGYGVIGSSVNRGYYEGIETSCVLGVRVDLLGRGSGEPGRGRTAVVRLSELEYHHGTGLSALGCLVAIWRGGFLRARERRERFADQEPPSTPGALVAWLEEVADRTHEATQWLEKVVWTRTGTASQEGLIEHFEEYLNLPLWRHRALLYEIWLLCETIRAAGTGGWQPELLGLQPDGEVWSLQLDPTAHPIARLLLPMDEPLETWVWREPRRTVGDQTVTPDISISTPGSDVQDLVVVEAKDQFRMRSGVSPETIVRPASGKDRSARGVGVHYSHVLSAVVAWVCNHCDFRESDHSPERNLGNPWRQLYLGSALRPGNVPIGFARSIRDGLRPPGLLEETIEARLRRLVVVVDTTGSMHPRLAVIWNQLRDERTTAGLGHSFKEFRGVLFGDHGNSEPYVVHDAGGLPTLPELIDVLAAAPRADGGDTPEALEDAIHHCGSLAREYGPMTFLVVTDAPPHSISDCPAGFDFDTETRALLDSGSALLVADDWLGLIDRQIWRPYESSARFALAPLRSLLDRLATEAPSLTDLAMAPWRASPPTGARIAVPRSRPSSP